jgi:uncharacterized protein
MLTVTYAEFEAALAAGGASIAAAEAHGSLCGALAAVSAYSADDWLEGLLAEGVAGSAALRARDLLATLYAETASALVGQDMDFAPLLPDDEQPLEQRVGALADWCGGFLYGLGTALPQGEALPEGVGEVLRDFGEISRAIVGNGEADESNEGSYAELVEYLRAGAQLVYDDLGGWRADPARA